MDRGYVRETRNGPPVSEQVEILRASGIDTDEQHGKIYIDVAYKGRRRRFRAYSDEALPQRKDIINDLRAGSRLIVCGLDRLGVSWGDIVKTIRTVRDKGCSVFDALSGIEYSLTTPDDELDSAGREAEANLRRENLSKARKVRAERLADGIHTACGGNRRWKPSRKVEAEARIDWLENLHITQAEMEEKYGVGRSTFRRRFGERGVPRGRPKTKPST